MKRLLTALLLVSGVSAASDLLGPVWHLNGKHVGDADPITWTIEYFDMWGRTVVDASGGHFYHDRCCGGFRTDDPSWMYPSIYWGQYPMYYIGTTMRYRLTLTNNGDRTYSSLRVVAIQEYLTNDGSWGERLGADAARDWYLERLGGGESAVFEGTCAIGGGAHGGLDQTHLQVQHWNAGQGKPGPGSVIIDDTKAAIWCPPEAGAPGSAKSATPGYISGGPAGNAVVPSVAFSAGGRGVIEPGVSARFEVVTPEPGRVTLRIYDRNGAMVREISRFAGGGHEVLGWDGTSSAGARVAPGVYLAVLDGPGIQARERVAVSR